MKTLLETQREV